ncbi:MAG TPA: CAP domain-containing protein [Pseudonocardiaceae bacterium]|nr:CAP domain-containing protein [Pseudonocardiaceae bacterium]
MNRSPRRNSTVRAMLVAVAIGAVVAGSATAAGQLAGNSQPITLASAPDAQIANAEELPAPGLVVNTSSAAPTTSATPTTTATSTTTTAPTTTTTAPVTTTKAPPPPVTTNPPAGPPPQKPTGQNDSRLAAQVFALVNSAREDYGCDDLQEDSHLDAAAIGHSDDMSNNNYFSHSGPGSTTFDKRIESYGYDSPGGENIAEGQTSARQVFNAWMSDSGHRDNILNCQFVAMGVGVDTQGWYWTQDFGY